MAVKADVVAVAEEAEDVAEEEDEAAVEDSVAAAVEELVAVAARKLVGAERAATARVALESILKTELMEVA